MHDGDESMAEDNPHNHTLQVDVRRLEILRAANTFLQRPMEIKNVAHAVNPIG